MTSHPLKIPLAILAATACLAGIALLVIGVGQQKVTADMLRNDAIFVYDAPIPLNVFSLTDDEGQAFTNASLSDQWTLVFFGYTFCPDICPLTLASITRFYDLLADNGEAQDVQVVMISVDPERDTQEVLHNYVTYFNPEFTGASGEYADVYTLARTMNVTFNYVAMDDENYLVNHNGEVMLIDPQGSNVGFFKPPYAPDLMRENFLAAKRYLSR